MPLRGGREAGEQGRARGGRGAPRAALTISLLAVDHPHQQGRVAGELQGSKRQGCALRSDPAALPYPCPAMPGSAPRLASPRLRARWRQRPPRAHLDEGRDLHRGDHPGGSARTGRRKATGGRRRPLEAGGRWKEGGEAPPARPVTAPPHGSHGAVRPRRLYSPPQQGAARSKISDFKSSGRSVLLAPLQKCPPSLPCSVIANMGSVTRHCAMLTNPTGSPTRSLQAKLLQ